MQMIVNGELTLAEQRGALQMAQDSGAAPWYRAGSAPAPVVAYQAKGATSLVASYSNLVTPGTNNVAPGVAPTFNSTTGWSFDGISQYLKTGVVPANINQTYLVGFSDAPAANQSVFGVYGAGLTVAFQPRGDSSVHFGAYNGTLGSALNVAPRFVSGILVIAGLNVYWNGQLCATIPSTFPVANTIEIILGSLSEAVPQYFGGKMQYFANWNSVLSADSILAISNAIYDGYYYVVADTSGNGNSGTAYDVTKGGVTNRAGFNGIDASIDIYSSELAALFNGSEGTMMVRCKVAEASDLSDGVQRDVIRLDGNGNSINIVAFDRLAGHDKLRAFYSPGGANITQETASIGTDWIVAGITWSKSNNRFRCYLNGIQQGTDQAIAGTWSGTLGNVYKNATIGAAHSRANPDYMWHGNIGPTLIANREASVAEVATLSATYTLTNAITVLESNLIDWRELDEG